MKFLLLKTKLTSKLPKPEAANDDFRLLTGTRVSRLMYVHVHMRYTSVLRPENMLVTYTRMLQVSRSPSADSHILRKEYHLYLCYHYFSYDL